MRERELESADGPMPVLARRIGTVGYDVMLANLFHRDGGVSFDPDLADAGAMASTLHKVAASPAKSPRRSMPIGLVSQI